MRKQRKKGSPRISLNPLPMKLHLLGSLIPHPQAQLRSNIASSRFIVGYSACWNEKPKRGNRVPRRKKLAKVRFSLEALVLWCLEMIEPADADPEYLISLHRRVTTRAEDSFLR